MDLERISSDKAPKAVGAYSQAIKTGDFIYTAGSLGVDPATGKLKETLADQTKQSLENLKHVLEAAGAGFNNVVKTTIFIGVDIGENFKEVNEIYAAFMGDHKPARSFIQAAKLPLNAKIEIEMIARL